LRPDLGTVEVRIMDAQSSVADVAALAALVHCLVRRCAESEHAATPPEVVAENRFLAARDGMRARLVDARTRRRRPVLDLLFDLLSQCRSDADRLGCATELAAAETLAADPGAARQRRHVARDGLATLPARLADEFAPAAEAPSSTAVASATPRRLSDVLVRLDDETARRLVRTSPPDTGVRHFGPPGPLTGSAQPPETPEKRSCP
jgi:hypothetical protein